MRTQRQPGSILKADEYLTKEEEDRLVADLNRMFGETKAAPLVEDVRKAGLASLDVEAAS